LAEIISKLVQPIIAAHEYLPITNMFSVAKIIPELFQRLK